MKTKFFGAIVALALTGAAPAAFAACSVADEKTEQELSKIEGINSGDYGVVRRDVRALRSAAMILQRYGKDDECQQVAAAMGTILRDPKSALDMRNKSTMSTTATDAAQTTETTETAATTETTGTAATDAAKTDGTTVTTSQKTDTTSTDTTGLTVPMTMDQRREGAVAFSERKAVMSAADLIGADVYGTNNESVGEIDDIVVSPENQPAYALISYGGFLGMGEEQAAVPVSSIRMSSDNYIFVPLTSDQLAAAPKLKRGTADWWTNDSFRAENDAYYTKLN